MKKILSFILLGCLLSIGNLWAEDPTYESYDWATADEMAAGIAGNASVSISVVTGGSDGNVSGHQYKALNSAIDGSSATLGTYLSISSAQQIDSVSIFYCPNGTNNTCLAWAAWGENVTPSKEVGSDWGVTPTIKSSKAWASAVWQTIDLSSKDIYTIYISRQGKKLTNGGNNIDNFGDNQTVNLLGLRVWLHPSATKYHVTYSAGEGSGDVPTQADLAEGKTFIVASGDGMTPPSNKEFDKWNDGTNDYMPGDTYTMGSADVTLTAQWRNVLVKSTINYANLNGADNSANPTQYSEGIGVASFEPITREGYVFTGWTPSSISASATGEQTITANWLEAVEKTIYSWESNGTGTVTEIGGTATGVGDATYVNYPNSGYYTLRGADKADFSGKYVQIVLNNNMIAGDNVLLKAYYTKDSDKEVGVKIADGNNSNSVILISDNLPNIYDGTNSPSVKKYVVPAGVSTNKINITRSQTATTAFIINLQILRTVGLLSKSYNGVKVNGVETLVTKVGNVITLNDSYVSAPEVVLVEHQAYNDETSADVNVKVENFEVVGDNFVGPATVAGELYTVNVPKLASYTVTYKFGETTLRVEQVEANGNPAEYNEAKKVVPLSTLNGWFSDSDLSIPVDNIAEVTITQNTTFYGSFTYNYATSINMEKYALRNGKSEANTNALVAQMGAQHYGSNFAYSSGNNEIDYLDDSKTNRNYAYLGLKIKSAGTMFDFRLANGNTVKVEFGNVGKTPLVSINGSDYADMSITDGVYSYTATADSYVSIKTADGSAVVLKQIAIGEDLEASEFVVNITLGANGYSTFATDYKYTVSDATVYTAAYNGVDAVVLTEVPEDAVIPANAGIILKGDGASATIKASGSAVATTTTTIFNDNTLVGVVEATPAPDDAYVLSTNDNVTEFNPCQLGLEIPAHKAYIVITGKSGAPVRVVFAEDTTTDINNLNGAENVVKFFENGKLFILRDGVVYDAMGKMVR